MSDAPADIHQPHHVRSDIPFFAAMLAIGASYALLIVAMLVADGFWLLLQMFENGWFYVQDAIATPEIAYSLLLSLISCSIAAVLSVWVAIPVGYLMSRFDFRYKTLLDTIFDIPIALPPLVIGISLLILFHVTGLEQWLNQFGWRVTYDVPAVVLAQFAVAAAFAVRTMRVTFDQIDRRAEDVALTLGCNRGRAFFFIALPQAWRGIVTAFTLAWARSLGEFGPILIFAGATRMRTEVLSTSVFLEFSVGNLEAAVALSLLMVLVATLVLAIARTIGMKRAVI